MDASGQPAFITHPMTWFFLAMAFILLIAMELMVKSIEGIMERTLSEGAKRRYYIEKEKDGWKWYKKIRALLSRGNAIGKEGDDRRGIRRIDHAPPPWAIGFFWVAIVVGTIYLIHLVGHDTQNKGLESKMGDTVPVDISSVELLTDAKNLSAGKSIYEVNCAVCHVTDGGGSIGPNLTDEYWIFGGGIENVFNTVSEGGRYGKGMVAWKNSLKAMEIAQVASYILTEFPGTVPAKPKAPEGIIRKDTNAVQTEKVP